MGTRCAAADGGGVPKGRTIKVGTRHERLVVTTQREPGEPRVECVCDCGTVHSVAFDAWGRTRSCGCLQREEAAERKRGGPEMARRNEMILTMAAAKVPRRTIAAHAGVTTRTIDNVIAAQKRKTPAVLKASSVDPDAWLEELLAGLHTAKEQFFVLGMTADQDAARIGALKAYVDTLLELDARMRLANILPRNPAAPMLLDQLVMLMRDIGDLMRRYAVADEVMHAMMDLLEQRMGRQPVVEGHVLPEGDSAAG